MQILSDEDVATVLDLDDLLPVIADAFRKQGRGAVERPDRPHFPVGIGLEPDGTDATADEPRGTGLVMPAYIHGAETYVTKLVGVHEGNAERGLSTVNATIALTDAATGLPTAYLSGSRITNARTGCIGGLAARELSTDGPVTLGVIGSGQQARWQTKAIAAATDLDRVAVYSRSESRFECVKDLQEVGIDAEPVDSAAAAIDGSTVVVTATTATSPVLDGDDLEPGTLVIAVGAYTESMRELDDRTIERAETIFADVPDEAAHTGDIPSEMAPDLIPFSAVLEGSAGRPSADSIVVVKSVGTAVLDAAAAEHVSQKAARSDVGTEVSL